MKAVKLQTSIAQTEVRSSRGKEIEQISLNLIPGSRRIAMFVGFTLLSLVAIFIVVLLVGEQFTMTNAISHPARLPVLRIANYESLNTGNLKSQSHVQVVETWTLNQLKKQYIRRSSFFGIRHATKRVRNAFVGVLRKVGSANRKVGHFIKAGTTAVKSAFSRLRHGKPSGKIATNDRIEVDIDTLGLSLKQKKRIHEILKEVIEVGTTYNHTRPCFRSNAFHLDIYFFIWILGGRDRDARGSGGVAF